MKRKKSRRPEAVMERIKSGNRTLEGLLKTCSSTGLGMITSGLEKVTLTVY